jgi:thioredoxin 1
MHHLKSDEEFESYLAESKKRQVPLFIKFTADWCGPCKQIAPHYIRLAENNSHLAYFVEVNVDTLPDVSKAYKVRGIPNFTVVTWKGETPTLDSWTGADPGKLSAKVKVLCG